MDTFRSRHVEVGNVLVNTTGAKYTIHGVFGGTVVASRAFMLFSDQLKHWFKRGPNGTLLTVDAVGLPVGAVIMRENAGGQYNDFKGEFVVTAVSAKHEMVSVTETLILDDPTPWKVIIRM